MTFPQTRRCPFTGRLTLIAPSRAARPMALDHAEPHHRLEPPGADAPGLPDSDCPFCPGNEHDTPDPLDTVTDAAGNWTLRVVPNKFPAVLPEAPAFGLHEVLIDCRAHEADPTRLSDVELAAVFAAFRRRLIAHASDSRLAYTAVFKNVGAEAGASLAHAHSQLVAVPEVPEAVALEHDRAGEYWNAKGRCLMCDVVADELKSGERVIAETEHFAALAAVAPRFAYEFWVAPKAHVAGYESVCSVQLADLAVLIRKLWIALDAAAGGPAYNLVLHTAPLRGDAPGFHWHWECLPRTARIAGFEWGTGAFVVAVPPEQAALRMRTRMG